ncbi:MAG: hypothetical protein ACTH83_02100 [Lactococcus cremoris]
MRNTEQILELRKDTLLTNCSFKKSLAFHLYLYLQILDLETSENKELRLKIEKSIDDKKNTNL